VYFPLGCFLFFYRMAVCIVGTAVASAFPKRFTGLRELWFQLLTKLVSVSVTGIHMERLSQAKIVASNHITNCDALLFRVLSPCSMVIHEKYSKIPTFPLILGTWSEPIFVSSDHTAVRKRIGDHLARDGAAPLFIMPEGGITNGRKGTMLYKKFVFSLGLPIAPCVMRLSENFFHLEMDTVYASFLWNMFWFYFLPRIECSF